MAEQTVKILPITDKDINDLLNMAGPDNVTIPVSDSNNILKTSPDPTNLNTVETNDEPKETDSSKKNEEIDISDLTLGEGGEPEGENPDKNKADKTVLLDAIEDLVREEKFLLFEGDKLLKDYSKKELTELFQANLDRVREEEAAKAPAEFFDAIPPQLQYAAKYVADGGKDLKGLFKYLAQSEEIKNLDIETESGQEETVRQYLKLGGDHTPEEIETEIISLKDMTGALEKKAVLYKPKLEAKQQQIIDRQLRDQEELTKKQEQAAIRYRETVLKAIQPGELNGVKITPTIQNMLFTGLTQATYPSASGRNTNLFGHLIEKYTYAEPNPALIAEALWLLKDRKGYHEAFGAKAVEGVATETFQKLKTAGSNKTTGLSAEPAHTTPINKKTIQKPKTNIFSRT